MEILVGELAKLYGLSSQTLHYYEEKGILKPYRNIQNGYRYYEAVDLSRLGGVKKYRNAEFSLQDGAMLCKEATDFELVAAYSKQKEKLWNEIERKQKLIKQLDKDLALYNRYQQIGNTILEEEIEGFVRFESKGTEIIFQDSNMRKEAIPWFENIMYTFPFYTYYINNKTFQVEDITYGMGAEKAMAKYLGLEVTENVKVIEGGLFLTSVVNTDIDGTLQECMNRCLSYIKANDYKLIGRPFSKVVFIFTTQSGERKAYTELFLPVKKISNLRREK